jgi:hypothetical protein
MKFPIRNLVLVLLGAGVLAACGKKEERASAATRDSEVSVVRIGAASP